MAFCAEAQFYVGGSLGVDFSSSSRSVSVATVKQPSFFEFNVNPMAGYSFTEKFSAGLRFSVIYSIDNDRADTPIKLYLFTWGVTPFVRNTWLQAGKLSVIQESGVMVSMSMISVSTGPLVVDGPRAFGFGVRSTPVLSYNLTERMNLEARLNLLSIGFTTITTRDDATLESPKTTETDFHFGVNGGSDIGRLPFQLGMMFTF